MNVTLSYLFFILGGDFKIEEEIKVKKDLKIERDLKIEELKLNEEDCTSSMTATEANYENEMIKLAIQLTEGKILILLLLNHIVLNDLLKSLEFIFFCNGYLFPRW